MRPTILVLVLLAVWYGPASGGVLERVEFSIFPQTGIASFDETLGLDTGLVIEGRLSFMLFPFFHVEFAYGKIAADSERVPDLLFPVDRLGLDFLIFPLPNAKVKPYALLGRTQLNVDDRGGGTLRLDGFEYGVGLKFRLLQEKKFVLHLRTEFRDILTKNAYPLEDEGQIKNTRMLTLGVHLGFSGTTEPTAIPPIEVPQQ